MNPQTKKTQTPMKTSLPLAAACLCAPLAASAASPYISQVFEYRPAPGQFVNEMPEYEEGDTYETMLAKAGEQIAGDRMPGMITLGAFGGYVVFGFDHPVVNRPGERDFRIFGNALVSDRDNNGGSSEPGIVLVSRDVNGNGLPDDPWYELAGSEYHKPGTMKGYTVTYRAPEAGHTPTPDPADKYVTDTTYIPWTSNDPAEPSGHVTRNAYHAQSYWPAWTDLDRLEFTGTRLAKNYVDVAGDGSYFVQKFYDWGYADNLPNAEDKGFDIGWAVDADGLPVALESIDFVKVHTGVAQSCGRLGETSTEVSGAEDLHPDAEPSGISAVTGRGLLVTVCRTDGELVVRTDREGMPYTVCATSGAVMAGGSLRAGDNRIDISSLPAGIYLMATPAGCTRFAR